jgi:hypothetical protein
MMPLSNFLTFYRGEPDALKKQFPHINEYKSYSNNLQNFHNTCSSSNFFKKRKTFLPYANQLSLFMAAIYHCETPDSVRERTTNRQIRTHSDLPGLLSEINLQINEQWDILSDFYLQDADLDRQDAILLQNRAHTQAIYAVMSLRKDVPYEVKGLYPEVSAPENIAA